MVILDGDVLHLLVFIHGKWCFARYPGMLGGTRLTAILLRRSTCRRRRPSLSFTYLHRFRAWHGDMFSLVKKFFISCLMPSSSLMFISHCYNTSSGYTGHGASELAPCFSCPLSAMESGSSGSPHQFHPRLNDSCFSRGHGMPMPFWGHDQEASLMQ